MSEPNPDTDPNEKYERSIGPDHPPISDAELYAEKENPVRETPTPFGSLREGGGQSSA